MTNFAKGVNALLWVCLVLLLSQCKPSVEHKVELSALQKLSALIQKNPDKAELYFQRGELLFSQRAYSNSLKDFVKAVELDSTKTKYYMLLSEAQMADNLEAAAVQTMKGAAKLFPKETQVLLKLSETQFNLKDYLASNQTIDKILSFDNENAQSYFYRARNFNALEQTNKALSDIAKAIKLNPKFVEPRILLAEIKAEAADEAALEFFDAAIKVDPKNPISYSAKASYLHKQGKSVEAISIYKRINLIDDTYSEAYLDAGVVYMSLNALTQAKEQFLLMIQHDPFNHLPHFYLGQIHEKDGMYPNALASFQQAVRLKPNFQRAVISMKSIQEEMDLIEQERQIEQEG